MEIHSNNKEIVIIGDSWSENSSLRGYKTWTYYFEKEAGFLLHNYSRGGSLVSGEKANWDFDGNLRGQVIVSTNDTGFDHQRISWVIIEGGVNDYRNSVDAETVENTLVEFIHAMHENFNKARILVLVNHQFPMSCEQEAFISKICTKINNHCECYSMAGWFEDCMWNTSDYVHPNEDGYQSISRRIQELLEKA